MDPLLRHFYFHLQLIPRVVSTNVVRVVMSVVALNRITGSEIGLWEILHHYTVHRTPKAVYYFKKWAHKEELIQYLPDSERGCHDPSLFSQDELVTGQRASPLKSLSFRVEGLKNSLILYKAHTLIRVQDSV